MESLDGKKLSRIKYFQDYFLTAILNDLWKFRASGIDKEVYEEFVRFIHRAKALSSIEDKKWPFLEYYPQSLGLFGKKFEEWFDAKQTDKYAKFRLLEESKEKAFKKFKIDLGEITSEQNDELLRSEDIRLANLADLLRGILANSELVKT